MLNNKNIYEKLHEKLNKQFGTIIPWDSNENLALEAFQVCFDIYESKDVFEEDTEENFNELEKMGTASIIDNYYVFFNDCNYDWNKKMVSADFTASEQLKLRNIQNKHNLLINI